MPQPVIVKINSKIYNIPILKWLILKMHKFNKLIFRRNLFIGFTKLTKVYINGSFFKCSRI